jgi:hypothetical protein
MRKTSVEDKEGQCFERGQQQPVELRSERSRSSAAMASRRTSARTCSISTFEKCVLRLGAISGPTSWGVQARRWIRRRGEAEDACDGRRRPGQSGGLRSTDDRRLARPSSRRVVARSCAS